MEAKTEDRRIRRTKKLLRQSLAELMSEKEFKDITVKEITDRVDLNRATFYLHYCDAHDLLEKVENDLISDFESMIDDYHPTQENRSAFLIINQIFDYISSNAEICKTMIIHNPSFIQKLTDMIISKGFEMQKSFCSNHAEQSKKQSEYKFYFLACGIMGIVKKWFINDMDIPIKEMVQMIDSFIVHSDIF